MAEAPTAALQPAIPKVSRLGLPKTLSNVVLALAVEMGVEGYSVKMQSPSNNDFRLLFESKHSFTSNLLISSTILWSLSVGSSVTINSPVETSTNASPQLLSIQCRAAK